MKKWIHSFCLLTLFCCIHSLKAREFGYLSYSTTNIGDDIQTLAAKRFLPKHSIGIDRDFIGTWSSFPSVNLICNGWFMLTKYAWHPHHGMPPLKSWPPAQSINPLLISMHFDPYFLPLALSDESLNYLRQYGPVGTRDLFTLRTLQNKNVPCYFSGCLTLTLENPYATRDDVIYVVDCDDTCFHFIQSHTTSPVVRLSHRNLWFLQNYSTEQRLAYAETLLEKYRRAKCVITTRIHAALPCLAFQTPVLLLLQKNWKDDPRFSGLVELMHHTTFDDFYQERVTYDFNTPKENPKAYLPLRENLIKTVTKWVEKNTSSFQ